MAAVIAALPALSPALAGAATEPNPWQCGATFTADVKSIPTSLAIGGQPTTFTAVDADTISFPAPSPAYAHGPNYGVYSPSLGTVGAYRNGCFSPAPPRESRSEGIAQVITSGVGGPTAGGALITVLAFGDIPSTAKLYVGDQPASGVYVQSNGVYCLDDLDDPCTQPGPGELGWLVGGTTPPGAPGFVDVTIRDGDRVIWGQTASSNDYQYVAPGAIESVTPAKGPLAGGNSVDLLISGDWVRDAEVSFGGVRATGVTQQLVTDLYNGNFGKQRLTVQVPPGASAGTVDVTASGKSILVSGPVSAKGTTATADDYTYEAPAPAGLPVIGGFTGGPAIAGLGGVIAIRGTNLGGLRSVKIGTRAATVLVATATQIYAFVPPLGRGSYSVTVTTSKGSATAPTPLSYRSLF